MNPHGPNSSAQPTAPRVNAAVATHIGRRAVNADASLIDMDGGFFAVADGMGDTARSRFAAETALAAVGEMFATSWSECAPSGKSTREARARMRLGEQNAHQRLRGPWWAPTERMGSTFAGVVVCGDELVIGHRGDSRVYWLRGSKGMPLALLTDDHTVMGDACAARQPYEVADAHRLTEMLGLTYTARPKPMVRRWDLGDVLLLSTDGLSDRVECAVMTEIIIGAPDLATAASRLVDEAVRSGGHDNVTAILVGHGV